METTVNDRTPAPLSVERTRISYRPSCTWGQDQVRNGGMNVKFGQRSKLIVNPKDEYGFRRMSAFKATYHEAVQPVGKCIVTNPKVTNCATYQEAEGYPAGMEYWHRGMMDRMSNFTEQNPSLLRIRAEAALKQQNINLLQFAAFLPSTLKNIRTNLSEMDKLLDILHDKRKLMQRFKGTEWKSLYLQWLFVWNQLHRDVVGGAAFLKKQSRPIGSLVTGRAKAISEQKYSDVRRPYANVHIGLSTCDTTVRVEQRAVSVARISCDVAYAYNALGIDNPVYLLWDLVRWSWVVDQIVDIGAFIQSITSLHGLQFLGTSLTRRAENSSVVTLDKFTDKPGYTYTPSYAPGISYRKRIDRTVTANPTRDVTLRNPFQNSVAVTAAVAAAVGLKMQNTDIDFVLRRA